MRGSFHQFSVHAASFEWEYLSTNVEMTVHNYIVLTNLISQLSKQMGSRFSLFLNCVLGFELCYRVKDMCVALTSSHLPIMHQKSYIYYTIYAFT